MPVIGRVAALALWVLGLALMFTPATASAQSCNGVCGGSSGSCFCDSACTQYGDCCADYQSYCSAGSTCSNICTSSSDCGYACAVGDGTTSWCGHYTCYTPEEIRDAPCDSFCDATSDCNAACIGGDGSATTCSSYSCASTSRGLLSFNVMQTTTDPCTEYEQGGANYSVVCQKNSREKTVGGTALGMKGWTYYSSRLASDMATAQAGARARFFIAGREIGDINSPALDAYALVRPIATNCKDGQTGLYLRARGSVVWHATIDKTCMPVAKVSELPGITCSERVLYDKTYPNTVIYDTKIPYASLSIVFNVHGVTASLSAEGRAKLQYTGNIRLTTNNIYGTLTPEAIGYIKGTAAVSMAAFGAGAEMGLEGTANIVDYQFPNTVQLTPSGGSLISARYLSSYIHKAVSYEIRDYLKVWFWFGHKKWTNVIGKGSIGSDSEPTPILDRTWSSAWGGLTPNTCAAAENAYVNYWPTCGDGVCNGTETACGCSIDCGTCTTPRGICGDGICDYRELCSIDCGRGGTCLVEPCIQDPL